MKSIKEALEHVKDRQDYYISYANGFTGKSDTTLAAAIKSLRAKAEASNSKLSFSYPLTTDFTSTTSSAYSLSSSYSTGINGFFNMYVGSYGRLNTGSIAFFLVEMSSNNSPESNIITGYKYLLSIKASTENIATCSYNGVMYYLGTSSTPSYTNTTFSNSATIYPNVSLASNGWSIKIYARCGTASYTSRIKAGIYKWTITYLGSTN